jgi:hypothetical protein
MDYEKLVRCIRRDPRLFDTEDDHKIHRILGKAVRHKVAHYGKPNTGVYSGLTKRELAASGTCETDWF